MSYQEPDRKFGVSALILLATAVAGIGVSALLAHRIDWQNARAADWSLPAAGIAAAAILIWCALALRANARATLATIVLSVGAALYLTEAYLQLAQSHLRDPILKARAGNPDFDRRSQFEMLKLRNAYPPAQGRFLLKPDSEGVPRSPVVVDGTEILPIAAVADARIVFCNETGKWIGIRSDEQGFYNPPGLWAEAPIELMALGTSFTAGACVEQGEGLLDFVRARWPETINLSVGGAAMLTSLALLKEFGTILRPKVVLWFFMEHTEISLLEQEKPLPQLTRYLDPDTTALQKLHARKAQIDIEMRAYYDRLIAEHDTDAAKDPAANRSSWGRIYLRDLLLLANLRYLLDLDISSRAFDYRLIRRILEAGKAEVAKWDGRIIFVMMPGSMRIPDQNVATSGVARAVEDIYRQVLRIAGEASLPVIDLTAAMDAHPDPAALFDYREEGGHYSPEGQRVLAEALIEALEKKLSP